MKKILTLFAIVGLVAFSSCSSDDDGPDNDTIPQAFEIQQNFINDAADGYIISEPFSKFIGGELYQDESILVYRLEGTNASGSDIWQLIPRTVFFSNGDELDYDYNFSKQGFTIFAGGNYNLSTRPAFLTNQVFRFVIIPSNLLASVNKNNYLDVMKTLKLNESQIKNVKL